MEIIENGEEITETRRERKVNLDKKRRKDEKKRDC